MFRSYEFYKIEVKQNYKILQENSNEHQFEQFNFNRFS